jgi:hypothetical protein
MDARGASRVERRRNAFKRDYFQVIFFVGNPWEYSDWLQTSTLRSIIGLLLALGSGVLLLMGLVMSVSPDWKPTVGRDLVLALLATTGTATGWMGGYYLSWGFGAITMARKVRLFIDYVRGIPKEIRNEELEQNALRVRNTWYEPVRDQLVWLEPEEKSSAAGK